MAKDPVNSEEKNESSDNGRDKMQAWLSENLRMIISIIIVVVIAGGIYSYSKRTQTASTGSESAATEQSSEGKISIIGGDSEKAAPESNQAQDQSQQAQPAQPETSAQQTGPAVQNQTSQETETAFTETAVKGDSTTTLARKALANYLEKNPDAGLTAEHRIYIEDSLRRQVKDGHLNVGETRQFSKDMIAKTIEKSKGLNERQLNNLQKYAQRVPSLK